MKLEFCESRDRISAIRPDAIMATIFSPLIAFWSNSAKIRLGSSCRVVMSVARVVLRMSILSSWCCMSSEVAYRMWSRDW